MPKDTRVLVIGLGRFGGSLALELVSSGWEVLGVDSTQRLVQEFAERLTHTVMADSTDPEALRQIGAHEFSRAVVGIGTDVEASILTTSLLVDLGVSNVWAKAVSRQHGRILEQIGAHHVVLPEHDMGERVAHLVTGRMLDFIEFEDEFALGKTRPPAEAVGMRLGDSQLRSKYGITVVCIKRPGEDFTYATADTVVHRGDVLIVAGKTRQVERFAERS
ncbi:potassium channel family protein [Allonocardiopsis opalescens]|uniref:Trk system potassium uptake protein TrkA n=1 Tax=Allonocardiopsis opalescens TaxID=1144618 RepID=A0A2T0QAE6_9ACTN|nr:TrkA family potassium uptake protein [Allonocardiopsis opalescens]PRY00824.1 trk system potassium uptake protein TrkA [Allonocardiopsis opalescens]